MPQLRAACQRSETLLKQNDPELPGALDALDQAIAELARTAESQAGLTPSQPHDTH
ncbi:hypothetical protein D3C80_1664490 [compost metagenome]